MAWGWGGVAGAAVALGVCAAATAADLQVIAGEHGAGFILGPRGVVAIGCGGNEAGAAAGLAKLRGRTDRPVTAVIAPRWDDQAAEACAVFFREGSPELYAPQGGGGEAAGLSPARRVQPGEVLHLGGVRVEILGAAAGDGLAVYAPAVKALFLAAPPKAPLDLPAEHVIFDRAAITPQAE